MDRLEPMFTCLFGKLVGSVPRSGHETVPNPAGVPAMHLSSEREFLFVAHVV